MIWLYVINAILLTVMFYEYAKYAYRTSMFADCLRSNNNLSSTLVLQHLNTLKFAVIQCLIIHIISILGYIYLLHKITTKDEIINYGLYTLIGLCLIHNFYVRRLNQERAELIKLEVIKIKELKTENKYEEGTTLRAALQCHIDKLEGSSKWTPS